MTVKRFRTLSRRTVLRGAGAMLGLPLLEAMFPSRAQASSSPKPPNRFVVLYMPNGVWLDAWTPKETGKDYTLPFSLEPLADLKDDFLLISNLRNSAGIDGDGHYAKTTSWLTGCKAVRTSGKGIRAGVSVDQLAAQHLGASTPLPSLELGIDPVHNVVDMGYSTVYGCHISWRTPTLPAAKEIDPQQAFDRLFRSSKFGQSLADRSVLDIVNADADVLRKKLGGSDQHKLDEYLDSVRTLEKRIELASKAEDRNWVPQVPADALQPPQTPYGDYTTHVKLMLDVMLMALRTDTTRVATFMFANDVSGRNFSFVDGVTDGFHPLSHHEGKKEKQEQYKRIIRYHVEQLGYFLRKAKEIKEGEGTLLDHSVTMFGSSISDGNAHSPFKVPTLLAGRAGGQISPGRHIAAKMNTPLCDVHVSILRSLGLSAEQFGDSKGNFDDELQA